MGAPEANPVAPPGATGPAAQAFLDEAGPVVTWLERLAADPALAADVRDDATHAARQARAALSGGPVVLDLLAPDPAAAFSWVRRWLTAMVLDSARPVALDVAWAGEPMLLLTQADGTMRTLDDLAPDPGPALEAERAELRARARDVDEARGKARAELDARTAKVLERTARKAEVEAALAEARAAVTDSEAARASAQDALVAADAYRKACETTVPAVLRAPPTGFVARVLHALLPLLYGTAMRAWEAAVEGRDAREAAVEAAVSAAEAAEVRRARLRRERVAMMNELHRLKAEVGELRKEVGALDGETTRVAARLDEVRAALESRPDARRAAWATQARVALSDPETVSLLLEGPDVRLPQGLRLRVAPDAIGPAGDVALLLPGPPAPDAPDRVTPVVLVVGGVEELAPRASAIGVRSDDAWAVSDAVSDGRALRTAAARAALLIAGRRLVARAERLDGAVAACLAGAERAREERGRRLASLAVPFPAEWPADAAAAQVDALGTAMAAVLRAIAAPVADDIASVREAVAGPLHEASDPVGLREASQSLASELQRGVDRVRRGVARALVEQATAAVDARVAVAVAPLAAALAEVSVDFHPPEPERLRLPPIVPAVDVPAEAGRLSGPLLRLRTVDNLRGEALAGLRAAADQAGIQLQARLHTARKSLVPHLSEAVADRVAAAHAAFLATAESSLAEHHAGAREAVAAADRLQATARALRAHAHALGEATRDLRLSS